MLDIQQADIVVVGCPVTPPFERDVCHRYHIEYRKASANTNVVRAERARASLNDIAHMKITQDESGYRPAALTDV